MPEEVVRRGEPADREPDGTAPVTDHDSKTVMLRAERDDNVRVVDIVDRFSEREPVPRELTVIQRSNLYYGPKLLLHSSREGRDYNYQLTAPGPDTYLYLWAAETDTDGFRKAWYKLAEVRAVFGADQPQYDICPDCGGPIKTLEHERYSAFGECPGLDT
jgi:hypothetical protein